MTKKASKRTRERMIHVRLPEDVHKKLKLYVIEQDTTIQEWVSSLITTELLKQRK